MYGRRRHVIKCRGGGLVGDSPGVLDRVRPAVFEREEHTDGSAVRAPSLLAERAMFTSRATVTAVRLEARTPPRVRRYAGPPRRNRPSPDPRRGQLAQVPWRLTVAGHGRSASQVSVIYPPPDP